MNTNPLWDKVFSTASWLIVVALFVAVVSLWIFPPSGAGPVGSNLGVFGAQLVYTAVYATEAGFLGYAKLKPYRRRTMRKNALMAIFLTGLFTTILTVSIIGFTASLLDNAALWLLAGGCWLYWTFKTEYVTGERYVELMNGDNHERN